MPCLFENKDGFAIIWRGYDFLSIERADDAVSEEK